MKQFKQLADACISINSLSIMEKVALIKVLSQDIPLPEKVDIACGMFHCGKDIDVNEVVLYTGMILPNKVL